VKENIISKYMFAAVRKIYLGKTAIEMTFFDGGFALLIFGNYFLCYQCRSFTFTGIGLYADVFKRNM